MTPKTIQIFLPGGDPQGIRIAEITTRIVRVIEVPRSLLKDFIAMQESSQVAVYFLVGDVEDEDERLVYIGQTGDLRARLAKHNKEKDFWSRVLVVISLTNNITQTHATFLEWHCLQQCRKAARYKDENGNGGSKPHTPLPMEADCLEIYDTAKTLLATLGYPIFDPVAKLSIESPDDEIYFCKSSEANGRGVYTNEGFVVLKDSSGRKQNVPSVAGTNLERFREKLQESGVSAAEGDRLVFQKDHLFGSPSMAAMALMGRTANGWLDWKNAAGQTLDQVKRQNDDP